ncbi:MAG: hypothetical protein K9I94_07335 [Bacteroidales bacterium]|nr:hypothetical protein [Bacteroidales bacterium]
MFFICIFIQVLVFDGINFGGYIDPYFYVFFILVLPMETRKWTLLFTSFLLGLGVDLFSNTIGMHAAAATFMAYMRPKVIQYLSSRRDYDAGMQPLIRDMGFRWFFSYSFILVLLHHITLFFIEVFRFSEFLTTLYRAGISTLATLLVIILTQYLFFYKKKRR